MTQIEGFRLSRTQIKTWLQPGEPNQWLVRAGIRVPNSVAPDQLQTCMLETLGRHEALLAVYPKVPGMQWPLQELSEDIQVNWQRDFWQQNQTEEQLWDAFRQKTFGFNFEQGPLLHMEVYSGDEDHLLFLAAPALILDVQSLFLVADQFKQALLTDAARVAAGTEDEAMQFLDFSEWHEELSQEPEVLRQGRGFWKNLAAKQPEPFRLPGVQPLTEAGPVQQVSQRVNDLGFERNFALANWCLVLARFADLDTLEVNLMLDGRLHQDFSQTVGPFALHIPIPFHFESGMRVGKALEIVSSAIQDAQANLAFRYWDADAVFRPGLDFEFYPMAGANTGTSGIFAFDSQSQPFHLKLTLQQMAQDWQIAIDYHADQYSRGDMQALLQGFLHASATSDLAMAAADLRLLPPSFPQRLAQAATGPERDVWPGGHFLTRFAAVVEKTPQAVAVGSSDFSLGYAALDRWSDHIAAQLVAGGVGCEVPVGVFLDPCPDLIVAVLAIFKAGGTFVAMDPMYPGERLNHILNQSGTRLVLTHDHLVRQLPETAETLILNRQFNVEAPPQLLSTGIVSPQQAAYILFTSGSTGLPKGVVVSHANLLNYLADASRKYGGAVGSLFHSSIGFDLTLTSLFTPLLLGGCIHIPAGEGLEALQKGLARAGDFDLLKLTPSHLKGLQTWLADQDPRSERMCLVVGGEALEYDTLAQWSRVFPNTYLVNEYGPTETTVGCCQLTLKATEVLGKEGSVAIGNPMLNTQLHVVDSKGRRLPQAMLGELLIAGQGVARGYCNQPGMTAARFVPDPLAALPGARCYRSGDMVRWSGDDLLHLHFHGRKDHQIKLRGFRIELQEIEYGLMQFPSILVAHLRVWENDGSPQLVAYFHAKEEVSVEKLRQFLGERLPFYMMPNRFYALSQWPLTIHGKLNSDQLPDPDDDRGFMTSTFESPQPGLEQQIAQVWQASLGVDRVGRNDNYFSLGGDSIRSVQTVAQLQDEGLALTMRDLFLEPTIKGLAAMLTQDTRAPAKPVFVAAENATTPAFSLVDESIRRRLPEDAVDAYPLGAVQLGMLLHMNAQFDDHAPPAYHNVATYRFKMPFAAKLFQDAVDLVVERHPNLRTGFDLDRFHEPVQIVYRSAKLAVSVIDITQLDDEDQQGVIDGFIAEENFRLMAISKPPLVRLTIHIHGRSELSLSITEPHSISDGWSTHLTLKEIFLSYMALLKCEPQPQNPAGRVHYGDFIRLERETVDSPLVNQYWREKMAEWQPTPLPVMPAVLHDQAGLYDHKVYNYVPRRLLDSMRQFADRAGVPLKSVLLAAHLKVLSILAGSQSVTTGLVFNGRPEAAGGEDIRGLFLNTLPFTFQFQDCHWLELVQTVYRDEIEMIPYRRFPVGILQAQFGAEQLFSAAFTYHHFYSVNDVIKADWFTPIKSTDLSKTNFDYTAAFTINPLLDDNLTVMIEANLKVLSPQHFGALYGYYAAVFEAIAAANAQQDTTRMQGHHQRHYLPAAEFVKTTSTWNDTQTDLRPWVSLPDRITALAQSQPTAIAVQFEVETVAYAGLIDQVNRIQAALAGFELAPEAPVAVLMPRNLWLPATLLAILRAGCTFLPLDVDQPIGRLRQICCDAGIQVAAVLPQSKGETRCTELGIQPLVVGSHLVPAVNLASTPIFPNQAAYTIYTSGSTGIPKGVTNTHEGLDNLLLWLKEKYVTASDQSMLQKTPVTFDIFLWEMFQPLVAGGRLVLARPGGEADNLYLVATMKEAAIDMTLFVPSVLAVFLDTPAVAELKDLKTVACIGEALPKALIERFYAKFPHAKLINAYGPTEAAVSFTDWICPKEALDYVTIGRPYANGQTYITSPELWPVPMGTTGNLFLAGVQLARGYLGRPALTAQTFLPNPFTNESGSRMYRTGDAARWLPNGEIFFIGRQDSQIKLRGYRIELGEIEAWLIKHDSVQAVAVILREDEPGKAYLCAYLISRDENISQAQLQAFLREHIPSYMVPDAMVFLDEMPRSTSGKTNKRTLAAMAPPGMEALAKNAATPLTAIGAQISSIWEDILGHRPQSGGDNFFEMGGQSLLATRALYRIRDTFNLAMNIRDFFEYSSLAEQAVWIEAQMRREQGVMRPRLVAQPEVLRGLASFAQQRVWLAHEANPSGTTFNMSFAIRLEGDYQEDHLIQALQLLVVRQAVLRTRFDFESGEIYQIIDARELTVACENISEQSEPVQIRTLKDWSDDFSQRTFDLAAGNLFEAKLVRTSATCLVLMLRMHHIVTDAWSNAILFNELKQLYAAVAQSNQPQPKATAVRYLDYANWQRAWLDETGLSPALKFWREYLGDAAFEQPLPLAKPRFIEAGLAGATLSFALDAKTTRDLHVLCREYRISLFMALMSGFQVMLHCFTDETDLIVGTDVANRSDGLLQDVIGFFVNQLALRINLANDPTVGDVLCRQRDATLKAFARQDVPFEKLVEDLNPPRQEHIAPLFQRKLVLNNTPEFDDRESQETQMLPVHHTTVAKMDLQLNLRERGEEIRATFNYKTALFTSVDVAALMAAYQWVMATLATEPEMRLSQIKHGLAAKEEERVRRASDSHAAGARHVFAKKQKRKRRF